jgi:hypothetical protein
MIRLIRCDKHVEPGLRQKVSGGAALLRRPLDREVRQVAINISSTPISPTTLPN